MIISIWDVFRFLNKWKWAIAVFVAVCLAGSYFLLQRRQSYSSSVIIHYEDASMQEGKTPDGNEFDSSEIISPNIITQALRELSIGANVDRVRSSLSVSPVIPAYVDEINSAKIKAGEEYNYYPVNFSVTYKDSMGLSIGSVRDILDAVMSNYIEFYCNNYINQAWINESDYDIQIGAHDYLEIAEIIEDNITTITNKLASLQDAGSSYRSPSTGLTFSDIIKEYNRLANCDVPELFADIYNGQVTRNKEVLIKKYMSRRDNLNLSAQNNREQAEMTHGIMNNFVEGNIEIPNSYNFAGSAQNDDDIDRTDEIWYYDRDSVARNRRATYDELINSYVDYLVTANNNMIDSQRCEEIINIFQAPIGADVDSAAITKKVEANIETIRNNLSSLYDVTNETINDYNSYVSSQHITFLSGVKVYKNVSIRLYLAIIFMLSFVVACLAAITYEVVCRYKDLKTLSEEE
ncbi:MAG: hypothetical protein Q4C12_03935 [Clostridia bacterium]|nr:hypothetical protein [Clostridia bacterium]